MNRWYYVIPNQGINVKERKRKELNDLNTHPNLSIVVSCCEAPAVPGESAASDTVLVAFQCVDALPGLRVPQLGAERNKSRMKRRKLAHQIAKN